MTPLGGLIKKFWNTFEFCNGAINKCILLFRKGVYPYECMDSLERFNITTLWNKRAFYSELNLEDITYGDYIHTQKLFKEFKTTNLQSVSWYFETYDVLPNFPFTTSEMMDDYYL